MRPLIEYPRIAKDAIVDLCDWKYVGKVALVFVPVVLWTAFFCALEFIYHFSKWFNDFGGDKLERFIKND